MPRQTPVALIGLALALALSACAEPPPPPQPTTVALQITGEEGMNGGAPARIKVYYLTADANFIASDFFALWEEGGGTLGADLVTIDEYLVAPGASIEDAKTFDAAVPHMGVVAGLRDIDNPGWKATQDLSPRAPNAIGLTVTSEGVKVAPAGE
ncbi:MAG: type VI secretion system lipoprotein TssJ [Pikeienuella sp.]